MIQQHAHELFVHIKSLILVYTYFFNLGNQTDIITTVSVAVQCDLLKPLCSTTMEVQTDDDESDEEESVDQFELHSPSLSHESMESAEEDR